MPTVTNAQPREAAFSEYGAGGPVFTMEMLERLPKPYGYHTLIDTLRIREAEGRRKMVRVQHWKYVTDPMTYTLGDSNNVNSQDELYDLENDPLELRNVAQNPAHEAVISEMRALLAEWMIQSEDANPVPLPNTFGRP